MYEEIYIQIIKSLTSDDYNLVQEYNNVKQACSIVGLKQMIGSALSDPVTPVKFEFSDNIYFRTNKGGTIPFFVAKKTYDGKVELFEMTYETYCRLGF